MKISIVLMAAMIAYLGYEVKTLKTRDVTHVESEWKSIRQTLADEKLMEFLMGHTNFVDEECLANGTPAIVERVVNKLD